ncbi:peptidylprolyl isomerase [bacterium]|nr:peptidylprolyl isomerase [bacterium]
MYRKMVILTLLLAVITGCGRKKSHEKFVPGTWTYALADSLSSRFPVLDPDNNAILIRSKFYQIHAADFLFLIVLRRGSSLRQILRMSPELSQNFLERNLEGLANRQNLLIEAKKRKVSVSDAQVDSVMNDYFRKIGSESQYLQQLDQYGIPFRFFREDLKSELILKAYSKDFLSEAEVIRESEIQEAYSRHLADTLVTVQHILLRVLHSDTQEKRRVRERMDALLRKARSGADFTELAKKESEDAASRERGGRLPRFRRGDMVPSFEKIAFSIPVGKISDIIESPYGYHILKVIERKRPDESLQDIREKLAAEIRFRKMEAAQKTKTAELKRKYPFETVSLK